MIDLKELPSDVEKLKAIISVQIQNHEIEIKNKNAEIDILHEALRLARMQRFAASSEKLPSDQILLFNESEFVFAQGYEGNFETTPEASTIALCDESSTEKKRRPVRKALPDHLPREEVVIDLLESEKICEKDGTPLKEIGSDISEQLDIIPAQMKVIRTIRKKYACPCCEEGVKTAPLPEKILPKSNATAGLLAHIATNKYVDALPLYRQEQIFKRADIDIPRNTMAGWMIDLGAKLIPILNLMEEDLLESDYVCCDETRVQVLREEGKAAESKSYMWVRTRPGSAALRATWSGLGRSTDPPPVNPIVLFDYDPTRSADVPNRLLKDFKGYLQADGYAGYDEICKSEDIIRVGCMAHVRRKFVDVLKASEKHGDAVDMLERIKVLYKIEEESTEKTAEERKQIRLEKALPILNEMKAWLDKRQNKYPPTGLMGKAITYATNQWKYVVNYLLDGRLFIDNNFTENRIRPFAVGRKNWLFSDSVDGAHASAAIYSILQTARANGLEPYSYMRHLLTELPKCQSAQQIEKLLPHKIDFKILN